MIGQQWILHTARHYHIGIGFSVVIILVVLSVMYNELNTDKQSAGFNDDIDIEFEVPKTCVLSTSIPDQTS